MLIEIKHYQFKNILTKLDIISNLKTSDSWKIQLTVAINFVSFIDKDEEHTMYLKSDNKKIMINDGAGEVIK